MYKLQEKVIWQITRLMMFTHWNNYVRFYRMERFFGREQCQIFSFEITMGPYLSDFIIDKYCKYVLITTDSARSHCMDLDLVILH